MTRAQRALRTAHLALHDGDPAAAIDRAYYAAFYVATAALLTADERPRTHAGTHRRFHLHFVRPGRLSTDLGTTLKHAFELCQRADYEAFAVFDEAAAADLLADVERFAAAVETILTNP